MESSEHGSAETLAAYERFASQYIDRTPSARSPLVDDLIGLTVPGDHVLELGSGPGRDASALEDAGRVVDRSDGAAGVEGTARASRSWAAVTVDRSDGDGGVV